MRHNVLITCAGRRTLLVQAFRSELRKLFPEGKVFGADQNPAMSAACHAADGAFQLPPATLNGYADDLIQLCLDQDVGLIIPTFEAELPILSKQHNRFLAEGVQLLAPDEQLVLDCVDKRRTAALFERYGVASPKIVDPSSYDEFPLIAKPFNGYCSHGIRVISEVAELDQNLLNDPDLVFFEYLSHEDHDEYTVDMYYDRDGELKCAVPRLRIETRGGEVSKGKTCKLPMFDLERCSLAQLNGVRGCLTAQFFVNKTTGEMFGIEINPRFGGGFPLSYAAGANYPLWIIQEYFLNQEVAAYEDWTDQLTMLRYDAHVLVRDAA